MVERPVPVTLVAGIDPDATSVVTLAAQWDVPSTVVVRHEIDAAASTMTRTLSDASGVLESVTLALEHACTACALREDVLPTLSRLARTERWDAIVAHLPVTADPVLVERAARHGVVDGRPLRTAVRVAAVVTAVDGSRVLADVLGGDELRDRGLATGPDDERAVGDTLAGQLERADVVVLTSPADRAGSDLLDVLRRPGSLRLDDAGALDGASLSRRSVPVEQADGWVDPLDDGAGPGAGRGDVWSFVVESWRPFHPRRLVEGVEVLASGPRRGRGRLWVPGRPGTPVVWEGAGGHLSIGTLDGWRGRRPSTRIAVCGVADDPHRLRRAFEDVLMTDAELASGPQRWAGDDGLDAWLGAAPGAA